MKKYFVNNFGSHLFNASVIAALAVVVALMMSSCNDDKEDDPAEEGVKFAKEICGCYATALSAVKVINNPTYEQWVGIWDTLEACEEAVEKKYEKWDENDKFWAAFDKEFENCAAEEELGDLWDAWWDDNDE